MSQSVTVDDQVYELDDETWHLKPMPLRNTMETDDIGELLDGLDGVETVEIDRTDTTITYELDCETVGQSDESSFVARICASDLYLTAVVDSNSGLLLRLRAEGEHETWPGVFKDGFSEITFREVDDREPITVPDAVDTSRSECIAETVGFTDPADLAAALDETLTAENEEIYTGCGFRFFPRGADLVD